MSQKIAWQDYKKTRNERWTVPNLKLIADRIGYQLLSEKYEGSKKKLSFICAEGHPCNICIADILDGKRCFHCANERRKTTVFDKYGYENVAQVPEIAQKKMETVIGKYGYDNVAKVPEIKAKKIATTEELYETDNVAKLDWVKERTKKTNQEIYGKDNVMQVPEIQERAHAAAKQLKPYKTPSGKTVMLQGYEPYEYDRMIRDGYLEEEIICGVRNVPVISYVKPDGTKGNYFPDFYISSENILREVKSDYTLIRDWDKNVAKFKACVAAGYTLILVVYDRKGNLKDEHIFKP